MNTNDPDVSELKKSTFITKADVGANGSLFTISGVEQVNVAKEGATPEMKWALNFEESEKPFVLNSTNGQIIAQFTGATRMRTWGEARTKVVVFFDPNVSFGGKLTGGLRCRAPRLPSQARPVPPAATPAPMAPPVSAGGPDEDVPF